MQAATLKPVLALLSILVMPFTYATTEFSSDRGSSFAKEEMISAISELYGLTYDEADKRLQAEAEATWIYQTLNHLYESDYAGAWFDDQSLKLVVAVTDPVWAESIRVAGAEPRIFEHGIDQLNDYMKSFASIVESALWKEDVSGWYVDFPSNQIVIEAAPHIHTLIISTIQSERLSAEIFRIEKSEGRSYGATQFSGADEYVNVGTFGSCSAGFSAQRNTTSDMGFITAGHCGAMNIQVSRNGYDLGVFAINTFPIRDGAWVKTISPWTPIPEINTYTGGPAGVLGALEAPVNTTVCRYGYASGPTGPHCGTIHSKNQSETFDFYDLGTHTLHGITRVNVCVASGDSGGPYITPNGQAQGTAIGGRLPLGCPGAGISFFEPVLTTLTSHQLTLLTQNGYNPPQIVYFTCPNYANSGQGMFFCGMTYYSQGPTQIQWTSSGGTGQGPGLVGYCSSANEWVTAQVTVTNQYGSDTRFASFWCPMGPIP